MSNLSKHVVGCSRGIVEVTGELIVDTGLKTLRGCAASMAQAPTATECIVGWEEIPPQVAGGNVKITLYVMAADGVTPGASAVKVSWVAEGE